MEPTSIIVGGIVGTIVGVLASKKIGCNHAWDKPSGGHQFCTKCNIARALPVPECNHTYEKMDEREIRFRRGGTDEWLPQKVLTMKCNECGHRRTFNTVTGKYL